MLSAFPDLLNYSLFTPFVLRLALAFFIATLAAADLKKRGDNVSAKRFPYGIFKAAVAFFLAIGLFTQVAALATLLIIAFEWRTKNGEADKQKDIVLLVLAVAITIGLLFSGAGFFAFDLPL